MIYKTPKILRWFYPNLIWNIPTEEKVLYLTFDDGPIPQVTEWVLTELNKFNAKATFFCIGENIQKHPEIFQRILKDGHMVGNHTFNHVKGWNTKNDEYFKNVKKCDKLTESILFRPPYGRIKKSQIKHLEKDYKIVMWSILTWDFLKNLDKDYALRTAIKQTKRGDIIVFHDSLKAEENLKYLLPKWLKYFSEKGFEFKTINV